MRVLGEATVGAKLLVEDLLRSRLSACVRANMIQAELFPTNLLLHPGSSKLKSIASVQ